MKSSRWSEREQIGSHSLLSRSKTPYLLLLLATTLISGLINFPYGVGEDSDCFLVLQKAAELEESGFQQSRTWGFPAYEFAAYPIISFLGEDAGKLYSLLYYIFGVLLFFGIVWKAGSDPRVAFFASLGYGLLPVSIISGNTILETSQGAFFALLALFFFTRFLEMPRPGSFYLSFSAFALATATRPDYLILSFAAGMAIALSRMISINILFRGVALYILISGIPFLLYEVVGFSTGVILPDPPLRKLGRALFGIVALFGIPAAALLMFWGALALREFSFAPRRLATDPFLLFFLCFLVLLAFRYILLPDELEYVYVLVPILLIFLVRKGLSLRRWVLLSFALIIPNFLQVHLFDRDQDLKIRGSPGFSPGAIYQDRRNRLRSMYLHSEVDALRRQVAAKYGFSHFKTSPSQKMGDLVIIPDEDLRFYRPNRMGGRFYKALHGTTLIVFPMSTNRGWRQFFRFEEWRKPSFEEFRRANISELPLKAPL